MFVYIFWRDLLDVFLLDPFEQDKTGSKKSFRLKYRRGAVKLHSMGGPVRREGHDSSPLTESNL